MFDDKLIVRLEIVFSDTKLHYTIILLIHELETIEWHINKNIYLRNIQYAIINS